MEDKLVVEHDAGVGLPLQVSQADLAHAKVALHHILQAIHVACVGKLTLHVV